MFRFFLDFLSVDVVVASAVVLTDEVGEGPPPIKAPTRSTGVMERSPEVSMMFERRPIQTELVFVSGLDEEKSNQPRNVKKSKLFLKLLKFLNIENYRHQTLWQLKLLSNF